MSITSQYKGDEVLIKKEKENETQMSPIFSGMFPKRRLLRTHKAEYQQQPQHLPPWSFAPGPTCPVWFLQNHLWSFAAPAHIAVTIMLVPRLPSPGFLVCRRQDGHWLPEGGRKASLPAPAFGPRLGPRTHKGLCKPTRSNPLLRRGCTPGWGPSGDSGHHR